MKLPLNTIIQGDALKVLKMFPDDSVDCVVDKQFWYLYN